MHALRHDEFEDTAGQEEACKDAESNAVSKGRWSRTMIGYGPEDSNFVLELLYKYDVESYEFGNDLEWIKIRSRSVYRTLVDGASGVQVTEVPDSMRALVVISPIEGFPFRIIGEDCDPKVGPISSICINVTKLSKSLEAWVDGLGLLEVDHGFGEDHGLGATAPVESEDNNPEEPWATLSCGANNATIRLKELPSGHVLKRGSGYGRIAFSLPTSELSDTAERCVAYGFKIHTPLETFGANGVSLIVLSDPDGHEVCLIGEENFEVISKIDERAPQLLGEAIARDGGDWFPKN